MPLFDPNEFMVRLRNGSTLREIVSGRLPGGARIRGVGSYKGFSTYCAANPEWGREATTLVARNAAAAQKRKGGGRADQMTCKRGHSLADAYTHVSPQGWVMRNCRTCHQARRDEARPLPAAKLEKVKSMLLAKKPIAEITGQWLRGTKREVTVNATQFYNARKADPDFDLFVRTSIPAANARAQALRGSIYRAKKVTAERREQANDYHALRALIPSHISDPDEIVSRIFEDILTGALKRSDAPKRIRDYVRERENLFPTKYRKFGDGLLVSLDEQIFEDGGATRGDMVTRGLWD
jgi:hypothetical protein